MRFLVYFFVSILAGTYIILQVYDFISISMSLSRLYTAGYIHKTLTNKKVDLVFNFWLNMLTTKIKNDVDE